MKTTLKLCAALSLIILTLIAGCAYHKEIKMMDSYSRIKPIAPLAEYEQEKMPHNLIVKIENVADMSANYKNRVQLYINNYRIRPTESYNYKDTYEYKMKLQPGVYKVRAKYYAYSGWKEESFSIRARENVKVFLNKVAHLSVDIQKNHWGAPIDKTTYFDISYKSLE